MATQLSPVHEHHAPPRAVLHEAALQVGGARGHHGALRLVGLVVLIGLVVVVIVLVRQRRQTRTTSSTAPPPPDLPSSPPLASAEPHEVADGLGLQQASPRPAPLTGTVESNAVPTRARRRETGPRTIEARDLTKRYGDKVAVDHLSFDVRPGHVTGFLGPNGAGKSTTMRLIMGLDAPGAGTVTVNGHRFHDLAWPLRDVGALLEAKAIHPGRSAYNHLLMLAQTNRIPRRRVDEVLALVGLSTVARQLAGTFSLGMGQRLGIAGALLGDPGVLLFDEPMNGLDTDGIRWVRGLLRQLAAEGRTVFVSSHLMSEMAVIADQVVVIGKGKLIAEMPITEFVATNSQQFVRVRSPQMDRLRRALEAAGATVEGFDESLSVRGIDAEKIGELTLREGIVLSELAPQTASLEEAFIESTEGDVEFRVDAADGAADTRSLTK